MLLCFSMFLSIETMVTSTQNDQHNQMVTKDNKVMKRQNIKSNLGESIGMSECDREKCKHN